MLPAERVLVSEKQPSRLDYLSRCGRGQTDGEKETRNAFDRFVAADVQKTTQVYQLRTARAKVQAAKKEREYKMSWPRAKRQQASNSKDISTDESEQPMVIDSSSSEVDDEGPTEGSDSQDTPKQKTDRQARSTTTASWTTRRDSLVEVKE